MKPISIHVHGRLIVDDTDDEQHVLLLIDPVPEEKTAVSLYLRFPFITLGPEEHIFPSYILDDWAKEIRGVDAYQWMVDKGDHFPRAEVFGFEQDGAATQCFVRGLEHYVKLPCYVFNSAQAATPEGVIVRKILIENSDAVKRERIKRPSHIKRPLASARVQWWQSPPIKK